METPPDAFRWPATPTLSDPAARCAADYRRLAEAGLPARDPSRAFDAWYRGPFQTWTDAYNGIRGRCDAVFADLAQDGVDAQVMLATQSRLHAVLGEAAAPLEEEPQMFVLATYWRLGAACTYQSCGEGPNAEWASLCRAQARELPACPPPEED